MQLWDKKMMRRRRLWEDDRVDSWKESKIDDVKSSSSYLIFGLAGPDDALIQLTLTERRLVVMRCVVVGVGLGVAWRGMDARDAGRRRQGEPSIGAEDRTADQLVQLR